MVIIRKNSQLTETSPFREGSEIATLMLPDFIKCLKDLSKDKLMIFASYSLQNIGEATIMSYGDFYVDAVGGHSFGIADYRNKLNTLEIVFGGIKAIELYDLLKGCVQLRTKNGIIALNFKSRQFVNYFM
jgi:hypothetical protein